METVRQPIIIPQVQPGVAPELPPGTTHWGTDLTKHAEMERDMLAASSKTPSTVTAALSPEARKIGGLVFHEFNIQTYLNLQKLGSPFVERGRDPAVVFVPEMVDIVRALWAMTTDDQVARRAIARGGEALEDTIAAFAVTLKMEDLAGGDAAISGQIADGFAPAAKMNPPEQEGGGSPLSVPSSATVPGGS